MDQGDEPRSLRPGLRSAKQKLALYLGGALAPQLFNPIRDPPLQVLAADIKFPFLNQSFASFRIALEGSGPPDPRSKAESWDAQPSLGYVGFPDSPQLFSHEIPVTIMLLVQIGACASHSLDQKTQIK